MRIPIFLFAAATMAATVAIAQVPTTGKADGGFFAALSGNPAAAKAALVEATAALAKNPNDADALVDHGVLTILDAREAMMKGDASGMTRINQGMAEMDKAVALAPDNVRVRIFRGIVLHQATREMPPFMANPLLQNARSDFQTAYDAQAKGLDQLGEHRLGELLQLKGDIESRLGQTAEAEKTYGMIKARLPGSQYAARADEWMATKKPLPANRTTCIGCHVTP